jgi:hypothetical protein
MSEAAMVASMSVEKNRFLEREGDREREREDENTFRNAVG